MWKRIYLWNSWKETNEINPWDLGSVHSAPEDVPEKRPSLATEA